MRLRRSLGWLVLVVGLAGCLARYDADLRLLQKDIEIDPGQSPIRVSDSTYQGPGKNGMLRHDVATQDYGITVDGKDASWVLITTSGHAVLLTQSGSKVHVQVDGKRIGDDASEVCIGYGNKRSCDGAGMPGELQGEAMQVFVRFKDDTFTNAKKMVQLKPQ